MAIKETDDQNAFLEDTGEVTLKEIFVRIKRNYLYLISKWKLILITAFIGGIIGFLYAYNTPIIYLSKSTFVLEDSQEGGTLGQYAGIASMVGIDLGGSAGGIFQGDNLIELYKSDMMIREVLLSEISINSSKEYLINRYIAFKNLRKKWDSRPQLIKLNFVDNGLNASDQRLRDSLLTIFIDDIRSKYLDVFKPDKKLSIIEVDVKSPDEKFSRAFNDLIVEKVNDFYIKTKTKKSLSNLRILQNQTDSIRSALNSAIYGTASSIDVNPNPNRDRQVLKVAPQRRQIDVEANKAILTELVKNLEVSKVSLRRETPLIQIIDQPIYPLKQIRKGKVITAIQFSIGFSLLAIIFLFFRKFFSYLKTL